MNSGTQFLLIERGNKIAWPEDREPSRHRKKTGSRENSVRKKTRHRLVKHKKEDKVTKAHK